jgi:D-alanyl-D-alanine carboxypeptidase
MSARIAASGAGFAVLWLCALAGGTAHGATPAVNDSLGASADAVAREWLANTGAPSVSIALVQHGALVYAQGYGQAVATPPHAVTAATRYDLDSVSKEFTATAILLLAEEGKLSQDDPLRKWFPGVIERGPPGGKLEEFFISQRED